MDSLKEATVTIEKLIRTTRLSDVDRLMKYGQPQRLVEIYEVIAKLEPGAYLVGCGPYTRGIYRLSTEETLIGREATLHEEPVETALDILVSDAVTFRPREISRIHLKIRHSDSAGESTYYAYDMGSSTGTYINGERLPNGKDSSENAEWLLADQDIISLGPSNINIFLFLFIPKQ